MRHAPPGYRAVVLTEEEARAGRFTTPRSAPTDAGPAPSCAPRRQVARCRHLYDSATGRCRFCGAAHPGKVAP